MHLSALTEQSQDPDEQRGKRRDTEDEHSWGKSLDIGSSRDLGKPFGTGCEMMISVAPDDGAPERSLPVKSPLPPLPPQDPLGPVDDIAIENVREPLAQGKSTASSVVLPDVPRNALEPLGIEETG